MKKLMINFTTSEISGAIARDRRKWEAFVQSNGTVDDDKYNALVASAANRAPEDVRYIRDTAKKTAISLLRQGYALNVGNITYKPVICGAFAAPDSEFDPKVNKLEVVAYARNELKSCMKDLKPVNMIKPPSPLLQSVIDPITGRENVLTVGNPVYGAGRNLALDPMRSDERGVLETLDGEVAAVGTITDSTLQTVNISFSEWPEPGEYRLALSTRSGMGEEFTLATVRKNVTVVPPENGGDGDEEDTDPENGNEEA